MYMLNKYFSGEEQAQALLYPQRKSGSSYLNVTPSYLYFTGLFIKNKQKIPENLEPVKQ